jgi:hypothetical protein
MISDLFPAAKGATRSIVTATTSRLALLFCLSAASPVCGQDIFGHRADPIPASVERIYLKGLSYLIGTQNADGTWPSTRGTDPAVVGLAVLAMLAHGEDANFGPYSQPISKGLGYILKSANSENGYIGSTMYNHGFATLALAEAYGSVNDPRLGPALEKAVALILSAQSKNSRGGWRYSPESNNADATVSGAQMVALFAARNAGIGVPDAAIKKGLAFLRSCQGGDGGIGYTSAGSASAPCTAIGTLSFALAKSRNTTEAKSVFRHLQQIDLRRGNHLYYYLYYASQAFFHVDMDAWQIWNEKHIKQLADTQMSDGRWDGAQGAVFSTSAALLSVAVNYRFLPIYER